MRQKLLFLIFINIFSIGISCGQTNVYHAFPDSNAIWQGHYYATYQMTSQYLETYSYILDGDTTIGNFTCHKLYIPNIQKSGDSINYTALHNSGYQGCISQDIPNKKVYYVLPNDTNVKLLYDFNLQVGDSVKNYIRYFSVCCGIKVVSIDSILIGSDYRKRWHCADIAFNYSYSFIEGIGNRAGLLESNCEGGMTCLDPLHSVNLDCFSQNNITLYPDTLTSCNLNLGTNIYDQNIAKLSISPNPFSEKTNIDLGYNIQDATLIIFNAFGQIVDTKDNIDNGKVMLERNNLPCGLYLIKLVKSNKTFATGKVFIIDN